MITVDFKRLKLKRGAKVLDIGCGEGRHTAKAWEFPEVFCIGADMSHKDLLVSQQKLKLHQEFLPALKLENGSEWALSAADITFLPFASF